MNRIALLLMLLVMVPAFAGRVITYTASSNESQEDANNAAMAGVAKQIVSVVNASQAASKTEVSRDGKSSLDETFFSSNNVKSNIQLKGVSVIPVKTDGKSFKATATLDMDEFTADIQFQIKTIKMNVAKFEADARSALKDRRYGNAAKNLQAARELLPDYDKLVYKLSLVYPLNDSHRLVHQLPEVESMLIAKLSAVKMEGPTENFELTKPEMPEWNLRVYDDQGPLPEFPLIVKQGKLVLAEKRTSENGYATFLLRNVNFSSGPYVIDVVPNLPRDVAKAAGLEQPISISYRVNQKRCNIRLQCRQIANVCNSVEEALGKKSIFAVKDTAAPEIEFSISSTEKGSLTAGKNQLKSYDMSISLKGENVNFQTTTKGVGKNLTDATIKALQKTDFTSLQKQMENTCE